MNLAVCLKITVDTAQLEAAPGTGAPRLERAPPRISTFDENALEEAVRLTERLGGRIVAVSLAAVEPPRELLLRALAMGADEVRLIVDPSAGAADALATATILARALERLGRFDLVLCGEGSLDEYARQVGPRLAEALGMPALCRVVRVEPRADRIVAERILEDRTETVEAELPALLTVGAEANEARLPTVLQILGSSRKPIAVCGLEELGFPAGTTAATLAGIRTLEVSAPPDVRERAPVRGESADEIASNLARELARRGLVGIR